MLDSKPTPAAVQRWIATIDQQLTDLQHRLDPLLAEQVRLQEQRKLLNDLHVSLGGPQESHAATVRGERDRGTAASRPVTGESVRERVHRQAVDIFTDAGQPIHVDQLHAEFRKRGYAIPGAGKPANITVHLSGWDDVVSPERGMFGLAEHCGPLPPRSSRTKATNTKRSR